MAKKKSIETIENINIIDRAPCENETKYRDTIDALEDIYIEDLDPYDYTYPTFLKDSKETYKDRDTYLKSVIRWLLCTILRTQLSSLFGPSLTFDDLTKLSVATDLATQTVIDYLDLQIDLDISKVDWRQLNASDSYKIKLSIKKILNRIETHEVSDMCYANELDLLTAYDNRKLIGPRNKANNEIRNKMLKEISLDLPEEQLQIKIHKIVKKNKKVVMDDFTKVSIWGMAIITIILLFTGIVVFSIYSHNDAIEKQMAAYAHNELGLDYYLYLSVYDRGDYWFETAGKVDYWGNVTIVAYSNSKGYTEKCDYFNYYTYSVNYEAIDGYNELGKKLISVKFNGIKKIV